MSAQTKKIISFLELKRLAEEKPMFAAAGQEANFRADAKFFRTLDPKAKFEIVKETYRSVIFALEGPVYFKRPIPIACKNAIESRNELLQLAINFAAGERVQLGGLSFMLSENPSSFAHYLNKAFKKLP